MAIAKTAKDNPVMKLTSDAGYQEVKSTWIGRPRAATISITRIFLSIQLIKDIKFFSSITLTISLATFSVSIFLVLIRLYITESKKLEIEATTLTRSINNISPDIVKNAIKNRTTD